MKISTFIRELRSLGVRVTDGTRHLKLYLNSKQTTCPRHFGKEIPPAFAAKIKKQLGLK